ncbi:MAG: hypothetical protein JWN01_398 [Patescibacteria group bacterium]|nr:hypothetical protein [Patescibacteria group bacterium]
MKTPISELSWKLADYLAAETEPPARCISNPESTEGEMMLDDEIQDFIKDSIATLRILADHKSPRYDEIRGNYHADLAYLASLGRIEQDDYNELIRSDNLHF